MFIKITIENLKMGKRYNIGSVRGPGGGVGISLRLHDFLQNIKYLCIYAKGGGGRYILFQVSRLV